MTDNQTSVTDRAADHDPEKASAADGVALAATSETPVAPAPADGPVEAAPAEAQELNRAAVESVQVLVADPADADGADDGADESAGESAGESTGDSAGDSAGESTDEDAGAAAKSGGSSRRTPAHEQLVAEGDAAGDYLERLLDILDFDGDIDLDVEGERAVVSIIGDGNDVEKLVGDRGEVLDALQELTRLAATAETGQRSRLMLDVAGYRANRRVELSELGTRTAQEVLDSGEPARLAPMNPFERKVVHDAVAAVDGVESSSEGEEPRRRVVVSPTS